MKPFQNYKKSNSFVQDSALSQFFDFLKKANSKFNSSPFKLIYGNLRTQNF